MRPTCWSPNFSSGTESDSSLSVRSGRIAKLAKERRERRETMAKLQKMVPTATACNSQLELLQHVIDYIFALQEQLQEADQLSERGTLRDDVTHLSTLFSRISTGCVGSKQRVPLS